MVCAVGAPQARGMEGAGTKRRAGLSASMRPARAQEVQQLFVTTTDDEVLALTVASGATVGVVKALLEERMGVPAAEQRLSDGATFLGDSDIVDDGASLFLRGSGLRGGFNRPRGEVQAPQGGEWAPHESPWEEERAEEGGDWARPEAPPARGDDEFERAAAAAAEVEGLAWDHAELMEAAIESMAHEDALWGSAVDESLDTGAGAAGAAMAAFAPEASVDAEADASASWAWEDQLAWEAQVAEAAWEAEEDARFGAGWGSAADAPEEVGADADALATAAAAPAPARPVVTFVEPPPSYRAAAAADAADQDEHAYKQVANVAGSQLAHGGFTVEVDAYPGETLAEFQARVRDTIAATVPGAAYDDQRFVWGGQHVANEAATLEQLGVSANETLHCTLGLNTACDADAEME
eukprot:CAMPEP_0203814528 /NCGR_PEP_ID=MMETSP0115-20131106/5338_1 /ASSEMBLY_ACC=CAM_ASM_000227 /TAXON_ID=33651 /ORGANISM="Bicosoecid sp, Strain ms1" /LENGTH=409 /DNA_ID=CAMNT_0050723407 /DNA_START=83 /DNA_END=1312 /DNA_ORIENTATION=+